MHISAFSIKNFRSLKDVRITNMGAVCIFHGLNNSGKSNVLAALELILKSKSILDAPVVAAGTEQKTAPRASGFYKGRISQFGDNSYLNNHKPISYELDLTFTDSELAPWKKLIEAIKSEKMPKGATKPKLLKFGDGHAKVLKICGEFIYVDDQSCDIVSSTVAFNGGFIVYRGTGGKEKIEHVPSLQESKEFDLDTRVNFFEALMRQITDCYQLLGTDRFLGAEKLDSIAAAPTELRTDAFKQFLFGLSTHKTKYADFKKINERFGKEPFRFGELSFFIDQSSKELEIMIEKGGVRLPLGRMGSGLQQVLFLIASILSGEKKIFAIEEVELNLSPQAQKSVFEMLKAMVLSQPPLLQQVLVTSHSPYFQNRNDVRYYQVSYSDATNETEVSAANKKAIKSYFAQ